jgi:hypothetical protein
MFLKFCSASFVPFLLLYAVLANPLRASDHEQFGLLHSDALFLRKVPSYYTAMVPVLAEHRLSAAQPQNADYFGAILNSHPSLALLFTNVLMQDYVQRSPELNSVGCALGNLFCDLKHSFCNLNTYLSADAPVQLLGPVLNAKFQAYKLLKSQIKEALPRFKIKDRLSFYCLLIWIKCFEIYTKIAMINN